MPFHRDTRNQNKGLKSGADAMGRVKSRVEWEESSERQRVKGDEDRGDRRGVGWAGRKIRVGAFVIPSVARETRESDDAFNPNE